jgi:L-iditol 2-dehydrogenase
MKVARLHAVRDVRIHEEPLPETGLGECLIRIQAVGICGSDLHWFAEQGIGDARLVHPLVLGHEFMGVLENGERVAVEPAVSCGTCELCKKGHPNLCPNVRFAGHGGVDGAMRETMSWDEKSLFPLPDSLTNEEGVMLEPLGVAIHSVDLAHLKVGMSVGVFGCGPIGLLILQLARLSGARRVVASDRLEHRMEAARRLGADLVLSDQEASQWTRLESRDLDVVFEVAGQQAAVDDAFQAVVPGGKVILVGIPDNDQTTFTASVARRKGLTIKLVRRMKHTYPRAIELVQRGKVDVASLVSHCFPLEQAQQAFEAAQRRDGLKVIINP